MELPDNRYFREIDTDAKISPLVTAGRLAFTPYPPIGYTLVSPPTEITPLPSPETTGLFWIPTPGTPPSPLLVPRLAGSQAFAPTLRNPVLEIKTGISPGGLLCQQ